ncbi:MAG: tetratricopeptide repeat protein, partial [Planctomycetota bacterium]|nr:tetratricopeptide repeat protein [Planctomycetota bacterium]
DTRADVYSLGVMLYELLTGELPFNSHELRKAALAEVARIIKEVTPPKPSTRLAQLAGERTTTIAAARSASRERITSELRRELDWIPLMALRKERERRYASPQALADDVQRYLEGRPLRAAPDSKAYLARKFVRRNKVQVFAASAVFLALSAGLVGVAVALWQRSFALDARDAESQRASERDQIARFQASMISDVDVGALGTDILDEIRTRLVEADTTDADRARVDASLRLINRRDLAQTVLRRQLLRAAAGRITSDFSSQPRIAARLWSSLAMMNFSLGDAASAERSLRLAIEQSTHANSRTDPTVLADRQFLGLVLLAQGKYADAQTLLRQLVTDRTNVFGASAPETAETMASLAEAEFYVGTRAEAQSLLERAAAIFRAADGPDQRREVQAVMTLVGFALDSAGNDPAQLDLASALLNRFPKLIERGPVAAEPVTMLFANYYAGVRLTLADRAERGSPDGARLASEAEALSRALLKAELELQPTDHPAVLSTRFQIARALEIQRRFDEALGLFGLIRELAPGSVGESSQLALLASESAAFLLLVALNRPAEARPIFERLIALSEKPGSSIPPDALADWKEALARATASETGAAAPQSEPQSSPP